MHQDIGRTIKTYAIDLTDFRFYLNSNKKSDVERFILIVCES